MFYFLYFFLPTPWCGSVDLRIQVSVGGFKGLRGRAGLYQYIYTTNLTYLFNSYPRAQALEKLPGYILKAMSNNGVSAQDLTESYQDNIIACAVATWGIAAMFVGLRFFLRAYMIKVLGWEDWVILASLGFSALLSTSFILEAHFGLGRHMLVIGLADRERLAEVRKKKKKKKSPLLCRVFCFFVYIYY